ncbi:MAG: RHS repeat-associated core domain-containing protein [Chloroflexota bacterium]
MADVGEQVGVFGPIPSLPTAVHTYTVAGTYTVTLTVSNSFGSDTATGTVTVLNSVADTAKVVRRINYRFGGQVVATRVEAEDENGQLIDNEAFTGLFYVHSDHLGSATALSYGQDRTDLQGTLVPDSVARFLPFGEYRGAKPQTSPAVSDRGFTGHKHNDSLGLVYMNARYYVPGIGRFASADTIVPDPMNPQGFNRYSYVLNNPIIMHDPSGHAGCRKGQRCPNQPRGNGTSDQEETGNQIDRVAHANTRLNQAVLWPLTTLTAGTTYLPYRNALRPMQQVPKPAAVNATRAGVALSIVSGSITQAQIYDEYTRGELTGKEYGLETGVNLATTGTVTYLGASGMSTAAANISTPLIGTCAAFCWYVAGVTSLAYVAPVGQGTVNNMIEGQAFMPAWLDSRKQFHDDVLGVDLSNSLDNALNSTALPVMEKVGDGIVWLISQFND